MVNYGVMCFQSIRLTSSCFLNENQIILSQYKTLLSFQNIRCCTPRNKAKELYKSQIQILGLKYLPYHCYPQQALLDPKILGRQ